MSWNDCLYHYHTQVGGQYFGNYEDSCDAILALTHRNTPAVLRTYINPFGRGYVTYLSAHMNVELERPYDLRIRAKGLTAQGLGTARSILSGGETYGQPQLARERNIGTTDAPFTKLVLQDLDFRNQLAQNAKFGLTILPTTRESTGHQVTVFWRLDEFTGDDNTTPFFNGVRFQPEHSALVAKRLDTMLELCYCASRAVTAYRMPTQ